MPSSGRNAQAEHGRAQSAHAEREAEEQARHHADAMRHHLLRVDHDRRERRGQHEADQHCQHRRPEQIRMRQHQRERRHTQDRRPDDRLATDAVTQRAAEETTGGRGHQEREQVQLRLCHRNAEVVDQVEGEVAADAGHVEVLAEDQHQQDRQHLGRGARRMPRRHRCGAGRTRCAQVQRIPAADIGQQRDADQGGTGEPRGGVLAIRHDHRSGDQRAERGTEIAAYLEHRLREAMTAARGQPRDARGLGVEDRRTDADHRGGQQHHGVARREAEQQHAAQGRGHADRQRVRRRAPVGGHADQRLEDRGGELVGQRDQADLATASCR
ncbi:hypothetical protein G6F31_014955 [Rhizopus arrhizus]|nr:hypothetical protein G6F31_014955 [Rhizopus arrhizus]